MAQGLTQQSSERVQRLHPPPQSPLTARHRVSLRSWLHGAFKMVSALTAIAEAASVAAIVTPAGWSGGQVAALTASEVSRVLENLRRAEEVS